MHKNITGTEFSVGGVNVQCASNICTYVALPLMSYINAYCHLIDLSRLCCVLSPLSYQDQTCLAGQQFLWHGLTLIKA